MAERPLILVTMGDPAGIGSEVVAKALADAQVSRECSPVVVGSVAPLRQAIEVTGLALDVFEVASLEEAHPRAGAVCVLETGKLDATQVQVGRVSAEAGRAAMEYVLRAAELVHRGVAAAMVTAPINKEACNLAGYTDIGHQEVLQRVSGAAEVATMLVSGGLRVVHLTTHRSLRLACEAVTRAHVLSKLRLTQRCFQEWGFPRPRIGVAALNPHGGEEGLLGDEEIREIAPAVADARELGIQAVGPVPADSVFTQAINGLYDVVLAMYHDQGHIAIKVHGFERSVSVNLGLPFIRTSVDHGTAFDIAGKGVASAQSMVEAIRLAVALSTRHSLVF